MTAGATAAVPGRSEVEAWCTDHLDRAARGFATAARTWDRAFESVLHETARPGWSGRAAEAAEQRAVVDVVRVRGLTAALDDAAAVARRGGEVVRAAKAEALGAIDEAERAGCRVGEDLSVTPGSPGDPAALQARRYAATIAHRVGHLVAHDNEVAARIDTAVAPLRGLRFDEHSTDFPADRPSAPVGIVTCRPIYGGKFGCSEKLPGGGGFHWMSPVDLSGAWPDFPR